MAWFGTDDIGRDLYSRILYGGRVSIFIGIAVAMIACTVGTIVGAFAGYRGGKLDDILMRITDVFLAFPFLVSLFVLRNVLGRGALRRRRHRRARRRSDSWSSCSSAVRLDGRGPHRPRPVLSLEGARVHRGVARRSAQSNRGSSFRT